MIFLGKIHTKQVGNKGVFMIYLDNAGTTKVSNQAKEAMMPFLDQIYGNASSLHHAGQIAKTRI